MYLRQNVRRHVPSPQHEKSRDCCPRLFNRVAGPGIEPGSGGYAYHYNFRYLEKYLICWSGLYLHLSLVSEDAYHLVSTPSHPSDGLGSVLPCVKRKGFTEFGKCSIKHFCYMSPLEPPGKIVHCTILPSSSTPFKVMNKECSLSLPRYLSSTPLYLCHHYMTLESVSNRYIYVH